MIDKLEKVLNNMNDIKYGYVDNNMNIYPEDSKDWDKVFSDIYKLQSPTELINNKYGVCWDQVELERFYLEKENISCSSYFIIAHDNKQEPTHTFIVVEDNNLYYWLEHSWQNYAGIHKYNSLDELMSDIKEKFIKSIEKEQVTDYTINIYKYEKPEYDINAITFMNYCEKGIKIS